MCASFYIQTTPASGAFSNIQDLKFTDGQIAMFESSPMFKAVMRTAIDELVTFLKLLAEKQPNEYGAFYARVLSVMPSKKLGEYSVRDLLFLFSAIQRISLNAMKSAAYTNSFQESDASLTKSAELLVYSSDILAVRPFYLIYGALRIVLLPLREGSQPIPTNIQEYLEALEILKDAPRSDVATVKEALRKICQFGGSIEAQKELLQLCVKSYSIALQDAKERSKYA